MNAPKRHHYLPAFYLDGFCRDGVLCVFDRERHEYRVQQPRDTAVRRYYYAIVDAEGNRNLEIEGILSELESAAKPVIEKLDNGGTLTAEEREALGNFIGFMFVRVPEFEDRVNAIYDGSLRAMNKLTFANEETAKREMDRFGAATGQQFTEAEIKAQMEFVQADEYAITIHRNWVLGHMLQQGPAMGHVFRQMDWLVLHPDDPRTSFVTTDKPICLLPPPGYKPNFYGFGIGTTGAVKFVPLSQKSCLYIQDTGNAFGHRNIPQDAVHTINLNVTAQCQQYVIGRDESLVRNLVVNTRVDKTEAQPTVVVSGLGARKPRAAQPKGDDDNAND